MTRWTWLFCLFFLLGGCVETKQTKPEPPPPPPPEPVVEQEPEISPEVAALFDLPVRKRVLKAIEFLEQGETDLARQLLESALEEQPHSRLAKRLIKQLDADPEAVLGKEAYTYDVKSGESLSIIAKRLLNDPLKFVILARYNDIENPSQLTAGQRLRIPLSARPAPPPPEEKVNAAPETISDPPLPAAPPQKSGEPAAEAVSPEEASAPDELHVARQAIKSGKPSLAISKLESMITAEPVNEEARALLVQGYRELANQKMNAGKPLEASGLLEKALLLAPNNDGLLTQLTAIEDYQEARSLLEAGRSLADRKEYEQAYEALFQALIYDPELSEAVNLQNEIRPRLVDQYHRRAMTLFHEQHLDEAIRYWDKVLGLDPNNALAPGYRARALELKQRLQKLR